MTTYNITMDENKQPPPLPTPTFTLDESLNAGTFPQAKQTKDEAQVSKASVSVSEVIDDTDTDTHDFFVEKCYEMLKDLHENTAEELELLVEDLKFYNDMSAYEMLDECSTDTNNHVAKVIFDIIAQHERYGVEPDKTLTDFMSEYLEMVSWENLTEYKDRIEAEMDTTAEDTDRVESGESESESEESEESDETEE